MDVFCAYHTCSAVAESLGKNGSVVSCGSQEPQERRPVTGKLQ